MIGGVGITQDEGELAGLLEISVEFFQTANGGGGAGEEIENFALETRLHGDQAEAGKKQRNEDSAHPPRMAQTEPGDPSGHGWLTARWRPSAAWRRQGQSRVPETGGTWNTEEERAKLSRVYPAAMQAERHGERALFGD